MKKISCIMSNYNTEPKILKLSIESILNQSFEDFELIIVDDCSTDLSSKETLKSYENNKKIKIIYNEENLGLAASLNKAIDISDGKYIARMDTDDIARSNRFEVEYKYLENHPEIDICSSYAYMFQDENGLKFFTPFYKDKFCKCSIFFSTTLCHPAVMMKKEFLNRYNLRYNTNFYCSQDFDLWARCSEVGEIEVINKVLLDYRVHKKQLSIAKKEMQRNLASIVLKRQLDKLYPNYSNEEFEMQLVLADLDQLNESNIKQLIKWINKLVETNYTKKIYDCKAFSIVLKNRVFNLLLKSNISILGKMYYLVRYPFFWKLYNFYSILYRIVYILSYSRSKT